MENRRNKLDIVDFNMIINTNIDIKSPIDDIQILNIDSTFNTIINISSEIEDVI